MTIDISALKQQTKLKSKSFFDHKTIIKKMLLGKTVACQHCQQALTITLNKGTPSSIRCKKGCTDIELEVEL
ncbi:hypothetical protein [Thalassotalea agarivorans]|uniref:hypothetical protein n=1 Tax=Thalassotalea agarivorans TaxID=349064 RepID=UPI00257436DC|nr:hypothetical protein [Thalassotalea agarivorans]